MTNAGRIQCLWFAIVVAITGLILPGCSKDRESFSPTGPEPAAPRAPSPGLPAVEIVLSGSVTDLQDVPISGAIVTAWGLSRLTTTVTDAAGHFTVQADHVDATALVLVSAQKAGYITQGRMLSSVDRLPIRLPALLQLPIDGAMTSAVVAVDPAGYVGEAYESDYTYNTKYFLFATPGNADVIVEISWERAENSALMMWVHNGTNVSERTGTGAVIRLPHGTSGMLLVGRPLAAGKLLAGQSVAFTLTTRQVSP
jgi:hypothetical protein